MCTSARPDCSASVHRRASWIAGELRLRREALGRGLVQRADIENDPDVGLVDVVPGLRVEPVLRQAAERMDDHRMGEADRQRALPASGSARRRGRPCSTADRAPSCRRSTRHRPAWRRTPWRCPSPCRCRRRSIRRWRGPSGNTAVRPAAPRCAASWCGGRGRRCSRRPGQRLGGRGLRGFDQRQRGGQQRRPGEAAACHAVGHAFSPFAKAARDPAARHAPVTSRPSGSRPGRAGRPAPRAG